MADGIGAGGGRKGTNSPNQLKLDAKAKREEAGKALEAGGEQAEDFPYPEDFGDGSRILFCWTRTHNDLLQKIIDQIQDDCWAWSLVRILEFFYNMNISVVAERKTLSTESLVRHVVLGTKEAEANKKLDKQSLAVSSLTRAIDYIRDTGIERDYGTKMYKIKANFLRKPNATPEYIQGLLRTQGPIGISVDVVERFRRLKNEIHIVKEPQEGMKRHALIIVGIGLTRDNREFFIVQNTWGTDWGVNGYGRIIIENTCPIFYVGGLVK